jgi:hypothetical protein
MGYVLVKFTQTRGGTELGFPLDRATTDLSEANFDRSKKKPRRLMSDSTTRTPLLSLGQCPLSMGSTDPAPQLNTNPYERSEHPTAF